MAGLKDIIGRDSALDRSIAETTMLCLREMKKQSSENVEMVKKINTLVESGIKKIKEYEVAVQDNQDKDDAVPAEEYFKKIEQTKVDILEKMDILKNELEDFTHKENVQCYKNIKSVFDEMQLTQEKNLKSLKRSLKAVVWFLFLIAILLILDILGVAI